MSILSKVEKDTDFFFNLQYNSNNNYFILFYKIFKIYFDKLLKLRII